MIQENLALSLRIFFLIILQIVVFNNLNFFGIANPCFYMLYIILHRFNYKQINFMLTSFFIGLILDILTQTAGSFTLSTLIISFIRPVIINFSFGIHSDQISILSMNIRFKNKLTFILIIVFIHQFIMSFVEYFNFQMFYTILKYTLINTIFTSIILIGSLSFFNKK